MRSKGVYLSELEAYSGRCSLLEKSIRLLVDQKRALTDLLERHGFSWERAVLREISKWNQSQVSLQAARDWLDQFRIVGRPDIGKVLLTGVRIIGGNELKSHFPLAELRADSGRQLAVLSSIDESGGTLAHLVRQDVGRDIVEFSRLFDRKDHQPKVIDVIEDALWTGTQVIRALKSCIGACGPEAFRRPEIVLRFGIRTDLGSSAVGSYIEAEKLKNVKIAESGKFVRVMSDASAAAFVDGRLNFSEVAQVHPDTIAAFPIAFGSEGPFCGSRADGQGRPILSAVGQQLWRNWLREKGKIEDWSDQQITGCALGCNGLGSHILFAHTAPTAALPVLWGGGSYTLNGTTRVWRPLFPR